MIRIEPTDLRGTVEWLRQRIRNRPAASTGDAATHRAITLVGFELAFDRCEHALRERLRQRGHLDAARMPQWAMFRIASIVGLVERPFVWTHLGEQRRLAARAYDEAIAREIERTLPMFVEVAERWIGSQIDSSEV